MADPKPQSKPAEPEIKVMPGQVSVEQIKSGSLDERLKHVRDAVLSDPQFRTTPINPMDIPSEPFVVSENPNGPYLGPIEPPKPKGIFLGDGVKVKGKVDVYPDTQSFLEEGRGLSDNGVRFGPVIGNEPSAPSNNAQDALAKAMKDSYKGAKAQGRVKVTVPF